MATFQIHTTHETYSVDESGNIGRPAIGMKPSGQWKAIALVAYHNCGSVAEFIPFEQWATRLPASFTYKNGKPRYFVRDLDHGTHREQRSPSLVSVTKA
jgi:hypothetical protein